MIEAALQLLMKRLFAQLGAEKPSWFTAERPPTVFVLRAVSAIDALALTHVNRSWGGRPVGFVHDLEAPYRRVLERTFGRHEPSLSRALAAKKDAIIFMRRPPSLLEPNPRGTNDGDDPLASIFEFTRETGQDVQLVPVTLLWSLRPEKVFLSPMDVLFGSTDMPGDARGMVQFLANVGQGALRVSEPISVRGFLEKEPDVPEYTRLRRLSYALLRRIERERRASVGPARKEPERLSAEVVRSPKLAALMDDLAGGDRAARDALVLRAHGILDSLIATPNADMVTALEPLMDRLVNRAFTRVVTSTDELELVREHAKRGTVVFLPSHKSHVDYLILSYVLRKNYLELPVVAAGDNLSFFPVGPILRRGGAFFIRREFRGDRLYAATVDAYVRRLIKDGWALEFFLEGGRSRTGRLLASKLGLLNLVVDAALQETQHPVAFVPVHIGYERTMEDFELALEKAGAPKQRESARSLLAVLDALNDSYGTVTVSFAKPIVLSEHLASLELARGADFTPAKRRSVTTTLAGRVERAIQQTAKVTAGTLVATVLLDMRLRGINLAELAVRTSRLLTILVRAGAEAVPDLVGKTGWVQEEALAAAIRTYVRGELVKEHLPSTAVGRTPSQTATLFHDSIFTVPEQARSRLELTKNAILHFLWDRAIVSSVLLSNPGRLVERSAIVAAAVSLDGLLATDMPRLRALPPAARFTETLDDMLAFGELSETTDGIFVGPGNEEADARDWLEAHRAHLTATIESARIALAAARALREDKPVTEKELAASALKIGEEMFLRTEIDKREAVSAPNVLAAFHALARRGVFKRTPDGYVLLPDQSAIVKDMEASLAEVQLGRARRGRRDG